MKRARRSKISVQPGVVSTYDSTESSTAHWVDANMVRFVDGKVRVIPKWYEIGLPDNNFDLINASGTENRIHGIPTWIFSYYDTTNSRTTTLIGTSTRLYAGYDISSSFGGTFSVLRNITPLQTSTTAIANSLATYYKTLANNPITTVLGSKTITIADSSTKVEAGDSITLSGCSGNPGGIPDAEINTTHTVVSASTNSFTVTVATTNATSSTSAGGASVVLATGIITVTAASHGLSDGDRVKLNSAADTGGIIAANINKEHIIRNKTSGAFDIVASTKATSSVSGGGGASTTYQKPIDVSNGSSSIAIWSGDLFGTVPVMTNGNAGWLYEWAGDVATAPTRVTNSPDDITLCFVTDNIIVTTYNNTITWCDQGDRTVWTAAANNQAGSDLIEKADPFRGHGHTGGINLLLTKTQAFTFRYVGPPYVFQTEMIYSQDGVVGKKAIREYNGVLYWMGHKGFYRWYGGRVEEIPNNTLRNYTFSSEGPLGWAFLEDYRYLTCSDVRARHGEIWWWPFGGYSGSSAGAVIYNTREGWWNRCGGKVTAAGEGRALPFEINAGIDGNLQSAEDDYHSPNYVAGVTGYAPGSTIGYTWWAKTNYMQIGNGDRTYDITAIYPDMFSGTEVDIYIYTKKSAQGSETENTYLDVTSGTEKVCVRENGRMRQYLFQKSGDDTTDIAGFGDWYEEIIERGFR